MKQFGQENFDARTGAGTPERGREIVDHSLAVPVLDPVARHVVATIAAQLHPQKVYLFGSRANNQSSSDSDVDVLLICDGGENPRDIRLKTHRLFKKPSFSLDVFVQSSQEFETQKRVANTLAREVAERGILCYG